MKLFRKIKKGFTLVELVVVIAVIAILAAVSVGAYFGVTESAKASKLEQESKQLYTAIQIVGNSDSDNHQLDSNGLHIVDTKVFEDAINDVTGANYNVYEEGEAVAGEAIVLKQKVVQGAGLANAKTYATFEYYTTETGKNAGSIDVVSGEYTATTNNNIEINPVYHTAEEVNKAIEKANNEKETLITFASNIEFEDHLLIAGEKNVVLDFNGYTALIKGSKGITHADGAETHDTIGLHVTGGANVKVTGKGSIKIIKTACEALGCEIENCSGATLIGVYDQSNVTIENGTFLTTPLDGASVLYVRENGMIYIHGGEFGATKDFVGRYYTLNRNAGVAKDEYKYFEITGGTFHHDNPSNWTHHDKTFNFVPSTHKVDSHQDENGVWKYTVLENN